MVLFIIQDTRLTKHANLLLNKQKKKTKTRKDNQVDKFKEMFPEPKLIILFGDIIKWDKTRPKVWLVDKKQQQKPIL